MRRDEIKPRAIDMTTDLELIDKLRSTDLFREIEPELLEQLAMSTTQRSLRAGEYAWRRGDTAQYFIIVQEGLVAIQRLGVDGEGVLVALFGPRDTLCIVPALQHIPLPADAAAVTDRVEVLAVAAPPVLRAVDSDPKLASAINRALLEHTSSLRSKIDIVSAGNVPLRIASLLLHLSKRFGRLSSDGVVHIDPALTREQIGQLVNARTETVIRIMSRWVKAGWIQGNAPTLRLLRTDMLQRIARGVT